MSNRFGRACCAAAALAVGVQGQAFAKSAPVVTTIVVPVARAPAGPPPDDGKPGSVYVQCDGRPRIKSAAELAADVGLITATLGLYGLMNPVEFANVNKRLKGQAGVVACDAALAQDTIPVRRAQLTLARAIHDLEDKNYEAALTDARAAPAAAGALGAEADFQQSLGLSAMMVQAVALVGLKRPAEAEQMALAMADLAPYDLANMMVAQRFIPLTGQMTQAKERFLAQLIRMSPDMLMRRAYVREWAGDFYGAAADTGAYMDLMKGVWPDRPAPAAILAYRAAALSLAGDQAGSNADAAQARATLDQQVRAGQVNSATATQVEETLDFQNVMSLLAEGNAGEARAAFTGRTRWSAPPAPAIALLTEKLRAGAAPAELKGPLAREPESIRQDAVQAMSSAWTESPNVTPALFTWVRPYLTSADYRALAGTAWNVDRTSHLLRRTGRETYQGESVSFAGLPVAPASDAVLLHSALLAKTRHKSAFVLAPARTRLDTAVVLFGEPGDPGFPIDAVFEADKVIADLSGKFPAPK